MNTQEIYAVRLLGSPLVGNPGGAVFEPYFAADMLVRGESEGAVKAVLTAKGYDIGWVRWVSTPDARQVDLPACGCSREKRCDRHGRQLGRTREYDQWGNVREHGSPSAPITIPSTERDYCELPA